MFLTQLASSQLRLTLMKTGPAFHLRYIYIIIFIYIKYYDVSNPARIESIEIDIDENRPCLSPEIYLYYYIYIYKIL